jgi:hypothetical protein
MVLGDVSHGMAREVRLNELDAVLGELDYPAARQAVRSELGDVTLVYADGTEPAAAVVERLQEERFEDADDLRGSLFAALPTEAVGEPGQAEGEG